MEIPRLRATGVPKEVIADAMKYSFLQLGYPGITDEQEKAILEFVRGRDIFISLPTGEGKSLCFASLPYTFDFIRRYLASVSGPTPDCPLKHSSICAVVSPLISLMQDQVAKFSKRGLKCAYVGEDETVRAGVREGAYQLIYLSPESLLCVLQWREMFRSSVYQENLIGMIVDEAHCVEKW